MRASIVLLKKEKISLQTLAGMVEVYGQVAATHMKKVKNDTVNSREYMEGLRSLFQEIKSAWEKSTIASSVLPHNNKEVTVFVAANLGFYGDIVEKTFKEFSDYISHNTVHSVVVLGREGKTIMADRLPNRSYKYIDFDDDTIDPVSLKTVLDHLKQFEKISIFHGKYLSTINQEAVATRLTGSPVEVIEYIFEPNPQEIVQLFEGEILTSVVEQALRESQLSKFAARILSLGEAIAKVEKRVQDVRLAKWRLTQELSNKKQRTRLISVRLLSTL